ncbi:hypothetical protein [Bacillus atrophaeus]|uniref:hypothetical protein n=1 Tax=Bacillus atrophaeus TaxID=1452 RepID=UPI002280EC7B|nr:hypothetical protein [Bacillus atrophaeus]MCY9203004.1 hypothetical protein [Bacillus atrophaeus]MEC0884143.1 hypothetical protein [Bacillus atrophaeus]
MKQAPIYVEIQIESDVERLWEYTQNPSLHKEWDLRFSDITYLHKKENEPQAFLYETRIGFGLKITGTGESAGSIHKNSSERASSLAFYSGHPLSLIKKGRGYWKYKQIDNRHVTFITEYQYETSYGSFGRYIDRFMFRPLLGWATAWSFDALRLWLEKKKHPKQLIRRTMVYSIISLFFFFCWIFHGINSPFPETINLLKNIQAEWLAGWLEAGIGVLFLLPLRRKSILYSVQMLILALLCFYQSGELFSFFCYIFFFALSSAGYACSLQLPSALNTKRKRKK